MNHLVRPIFLFLGRLLSRLLLRIQVIGAENAPDEPLIVASNHFSWLDGIILTLHLPMQPAYLIATESRRLWYYRVATDPFNTIPIWRGRVDRKALNRALQVLEEGGSIGVFPEGGIDPGMAEARKRGELITTVRGHFARHQAELIAPRPGIAFLAAQTNARVLPVAILGTENILTNLKRLRRTPVTIRIGKAFGPLRLDEKLRGRARRAQLDALAEQVMERIAALLPPHQRGPYRRIPDAK